MRIISISLVLLIVLGGCSKKENHKIGFLFSAKTTARYIKEGNLFKEKAEELGAQVIIDDGNGSEALQYDKAIEMFDNGIDALVLIAINSNTAASIVREGQERGIKVIAYNRLIFNCEPDLYVSGNNETLGKHMVDAVLNKTKTGNVVILGGDKYDRNAIGLMKSIDDHIKPYVESGQFKILYKTFIEEWSDVNAAYEMQQFLSMTNQKPDVVFAGYDGMSAAIIRVLEEKEMLDGVYITGQDAELRGIKNIVAGKQLMTVFHPLTDNAYRAAELTIDLLNGKMPSKDELSYTNNGMIDVPTIKIESIPVTKDNIDEVLINTGVYSKDEVYN